MNRREFILQLGVTTSLTLFGFDKKARYQIMSVDGPLDYRKLGTTLTHEHVLVDFIGADQYDSTRWIRDQVVEAVLPYLAELKSLGVQSVFDFTPAYLGRDPLLLKDLSTTTGLNLITNTGYYGAVDHKYLPTMAFTATAEELAKIWIQEFKTGIEGTDVRPGFIKISVNQSPLNTVDRKLVEAAAITHLETGLTIASHTGPAQPAYEQLDILRQNGVDPSAFIWVHAQNERDKSTYVKAAELGAWVSLDGIQESNIEQYVQDLAMFKSQLGLKNVLISQDAGWYQPGTEWNGPIRDYTALVKHLLPKLQQTGFSKKDVHQLLVKNPRQAFAIRIRKK